MPLDLVHRLEAWSLSAWFVFCRMLPLDTASALGGRLGRMIGPHMKAHRYALNNLALALPELDAKERQSIAIRMWDQLGRIAGELSFLPDQLTRRVQYEGLENLPEKGQPVVFISGHIGNWELLYSIAYDQGVPVTLVYRHANNPYADAIIADMRASHCSGMLPKGQKGAIRLVRTLKNRQSLAMLVDQKMNEGIPVPFFGHDAMTAPAVAELSLRYNLPIVPARIIRTKGAHFRAILYPPLKYAPTGDMEQDAKAVMTQINAMLESWIREYPEQWFWVHRRWPKH